MGRGHLARWIILFTALLAPGCAASPAGAGTSPAASARAEATATSPESVGAPAIAAPTLLPQTVVLGYSSISADYLPTWVAIEAGLFTKYGVDVQSLHIASGTTTMQSLVAGDVQFAISAAPESVAARVAGAPVRVVLTANRSLAASFMVDSAITSPEQLKGKLIGISRFGGQPHVAARLALKQWGLDPDNDVQYLQLGGVGEILAGMQQGAVVGGVFSPPTNVRAQRLGYRVLANLVDLDLPFETGTWTAMQPYLDANPEALRRLMRAVVEGVKLTLTDDALARSTLGKYTQVDDPDSLMSTIHYMRPIYRRVPYPSLPALQAHLDDAAETDPRARGITAEQLADASALQAIEREGFVKQLYGEAVVAGR